MGQDSVLEFIHRRFPNSFYSDSKWMNGNCYYFSVILKERFSGVIFYDVIHGHFLTLINHCFYDASGLVYKLDKEEQSILNNLKNTYIELKYGIIVVNWDTFSLYDSLQKERIIRDCLL